MEKTISRRTAAADKEITLASGHSAQSNNIIGEQNNVRNSSITNGSKDPNRRTAKKDVGQKQPRGRNPNRLGRRKGHIQERIDDL